MRELLSLREVVALDEECMKLFGQAEALCRSKFDFTKSKCMLPPFFTDHTVAHFQKVEEILDQMIYGCEKLDDRAFVPNAEEAMYLLSAVWLHDLGMLYRLFPGETGQGDDIRWEDCRNDHERRSAEYILKNWNDNCDWSHFEKMKLGVVCMHHRKRHSLQDMQPSFEEQVTRTGKPIRLRELAALLRLADACHFDASRVPQDQLNQFEAIGMPIESKKHWSLPVMVESVVLDHNGQTIRPQCYIPRATKLGTAFIDFQPMVDTLCQELEKELKTVVP